MRYSSLSLWKKRGRVIVKECCKHWLVVVLQEIKWPGVCGAQYLRSGSEDTTIFGVPVETNDGIEGVVGLLKRFISNPLVRFTDSGGVLVVTDTKRFSNTLMSSVLRLVTSSSPRSFSSKRSAVSVSVSTVLLLFLLVVREAMLEMNCVEATTVFCGNFNTKSTKKHDGSSNINVGGPWIRAESKVIKVSGTRIGDAKRYVYTVLTSDPKVGEIAYTKHGSANSFGRYWRFIIREACIEVKIYSNGGDYIDRGEWRVNLQHQCLYLAKEEVRHHRFTVRTFRHW